MIKLLFAQLIIALCCVVGLAQAPKMAQDADGKIHYVVPTKADVSATTPQDSQVSAPTAAKQALPAIPTPIDKPTVKSGGRTVAELQAEMAAKNKPAQVIAAAANHTDSAAATTHAEPQRPSTIIPTPTTPNPEQKMSEEARNGFKEKVVVQATYEDSTLIARSETFPMVALPKTKVVPTVVKPRQAFEKALGTGFGDYAKVTLGMGSAGYGFGRSWNIGAGFRKQKEKIVARAEFEQAPNQKKWFIQGGGHSYKFTSELAYMIGEHFQPAVIFVYGGYSNPLFNKKGLFLGGGFRWVGASDDKKIFYEPGLFVIPQLAEWVNGNPTHGADKSYFNIRFDLPVLFKLNNSLAVGMNLRAQYGRLVEDNIKHNLWATDVKFVAAYRFNK
jgi:hypothetical protein